MRGYTLIPALIDCHLHLSLPTREPANIKKRSTALLEAGIFAVRDAGITDGTCFTIHPLTIIHTGQALSKAGCYGANLGRALTSFNHAEKMVDELYSQGVSQIKVIASGIFSFTRYGELCNPTFTASELHAIVAQAKQYELPVMAHASGNEAVLNCIRAGVASVEHGYFLSEEALSMMAEQGIAWVPTLAPVAAQLLNDSLFSTLSCNQKDTIRRSLERHQKMIALSDRYKVRLAAGTDAGAPGVPHGISLLTELQLLKECGISSLRVLQAATSEAAAVCGLQSVAGTIKPGKKPYFLAVQGNPLDDLSVLNKASHLLLPS
jgi:imidazolonepropionase-like amidohydrolase